MVIVGIPKEVKSHEYRTSVLPVGVDELSRRGHSVLVQRDAGLGSGIRDEEYEKVGATLIDDAATIFQRAELIVKVKEPAPQEIELLRPGQLVFTYFHFAASEALTKGVIASGATAIAYETLRDDGGRLKLLTPMSEVAGRMSIQQGAKYLERPQEGRGILLGGVPGVEPAHITILGGGVVGTNAAKIASGFGAAVYVLDNNLERLRYLDDVMPPNVTTVFSDRYTILDQLMRADLVVGAVLIPGARTPRLVLRADLKVMKPGAVVVDVAVDQGGCFETTRQRRTPSRLRHRRGGALRRREHARRGRANQHLRALQRHVPVRARARGGRARRCAPEPAARDRREHPPGSGDRACGGRDLRLAVRAVLSLTVTR